ncbi:site-specific integrase [Bradyrhizobium yuanmingense]|uniref:tyrosine-type recombinase/integrase n=1 Tax=Bradyrhizobium yuanmingense TaxID=108015 RepID=UPI0021A40364|nr:site-specific integrase [Bradyrhizobium sp. CB1024]UWU84921.1 site-specific integrase [Bradyrhizobium sp. CB1024]
MGLGKQAKTLSRGQVEATLAYLSTTRYPERNRLIFLLSAKSGLRAKEIAHLTWRMVCDATGQVGHAIHLTNDASKGRSGRVIPMHAEARAALIAYRQTLTKVTGDYVISTERMSSTSPQVVVNMFQRWYQHLGFVGCSSHSGRRTFITGAARKISTVGGSLRDVQALAGHSNLRTTQQYIEQDVDAQRKVIQQL